jgi:TonB family protein
MPALWSPEDLATRFAPYIEELHDVFAMHGLRYGSPEDIGPLAARLETPGLLAEEVAALVRSMVLREGGSMPRTDLLEIVAIAISGPRMDPGGEELQRPVRQLLTFLHGCLRRPWNEPAGEERLHPEGGASRAEAARELREAAARIEAESQTQDEQPVHEPEGETDVHSRANVIPFGRARAVFSRLAGFDGDSLPHEVEQMQQEHAELLEREEQQQERREDKEAEYVAPSAPWNTPALVGLPQEPSLQSVASPQPKLMAPRTQESTVPASPLATAPHHTQEHSAAVQNVAPALPTPGDYTPSRTQVQPTAAAAIPKPPVIAEDSPREFDAEPPMPAPQRPMRVVLVSGAIAAVLVVGIFGVSSLGLSSAATPPSDGGPSEASATAKPALPQVAKPAPGMVSSTAMVQAASTQPAAGKPHPYDDYIAPPHSNMPLQSAVAAAGQAPASQTANAAAPQQPVLVARPRDPDGIAVGDPRVRIAPVVLEEPPPIHPRVPGAVMAMNVIAAPRPDYPMLAKIAHVDGSVVIHAEIGRSGSVVDTDVISGHHLLRHAAEDAVRHWRYKPYEVDGRAVPVSTTITVRFRH